MSGTVSGGIKVASILLAQNPLYYKQIGSRGGKARNPRKGFGSSGKGSLGGQLGGLISRRGGKRLSKTERDKIKRQFYANYERLTAIHNQAQGVKA